MKTPDIDKYKSTQDYFRDFGKLNSNLSKRNLSSRLGWPQPLLSEIITSKKKLTLSRAIQFSQVCALNCYETEKLVLWTMRDGSNLGVTQMAERVLSSTDMKNINSNLKVLDDPDMQIVFAIVQWLESADVDKIKRLLNTTKPTLSVDQISTKIEELQNLGIMTVEKDSSRVIFTVKNAWRDSFEKAAKQRVKEVHSPYAQNFLNYMESPVDPKTLNSGYIVVDKRTFSQIRNKIISLRSYLIGHNNTAKLKSNAEETLLCQFDLNVFPIVNCAGD